jgi:hypothetical protein
MKTFFAILLVVLLGIALGIGTATLRIRLTPWNSKPGEGSDARGGTAKPGGPTPKAVVKDAAFDFGTLDIESSGSHDFVVANKGAAPLELTPGETSCRCAASKLERPRVPPGGSTKITITWKPDEKPGPYQQTAAIVTNDPQQPRIVLTVSGKITAKAWLSPPEVVFSRLTSKEAAKTEAVLLCYLDAPEHFKQPEGEKSAQADKKVSQPPARVVQVVGHRWDDPKTAAFFEVAVQPMTLEEVKKADPEAKSGRRIVISVKPGLPQGPIRQKLWLQTNMIVSPTLSLPIQGTVTGDIAIVGQGWNADTGILTLGAVSSAQGAQRRLLLVVRGPHRKQVAFKLAKVAPSAVKASFGPSSELNDGVVVQTPLVINIPQGSPRVSCLGPEPSKMGEIIVETTHPQVSKLRLLLCFAVEE